jgi:hypothetical protein
MDSTSLSSKLIFFSEVYRTNFKEQTYKEPYGLAFHTQAAAPLPPEESSGGRELKEGNNALL